MIEISSLLGLPPVPTYSGQTLWNHHRIETKTGLQTLHFPTSFTGASDEAAFFTISVIIEKRGAALIPLLLDGIQATKDNDSLALTSCLNDAERILLEMTALLPTLLPECSPDFFYFTLRPYLEGTADLEAVGMPDGILYETITTDGGVERVRQKYRGPSNAQSSLFAFVDIALGVKHYGEDVLSLDGTERREDVELKKSKEKFLKVGKVNGTVGYDNDNDTISS